MRSFIATSVSALLLAACAGAPNGSTPASTAAAGPGTMYCWKRTLATVGDTLVCNWESSSREACRSIGEVRLAKARVVGEPRDAGRCDNGEWLVAVTTK